MDLSKRSVGSTDDYSIAATVSEAYLALLASRGVEYLFGNAGTDFAPIVEAYSKLAAKDIPAPRPILTAHETVTVAMAHGYSVRTGRAPVMMVHVGVGTANAACQLINAAREQIPMVFTAGRTPLLEYGRSGARDTYIHWAQEMFDQAGIVREFVKWDYELRNADQLETIVDRAFSIACSEPCGISYLTLPREVLAEPASSLKPSNASRQTAAATPRGNANAIGEAAAILATAQNPLIITTNAGRTPEASHALAGFAERFAIPVVEFFRRFVGIPSDHPMQAGYDPHIHIGQADAILVIDSDVPWIPNQTQPKPYCKVIHLGVEPLFQRYPVRSFQTDAAISSDVEQGLADLSSAMKGQIDDAMVQSRFEKISTKNRQRRLVLKQSTMALTDQRPIHPSWVSKCISDMKGKDGLVFDEYPLVPDDCDFTEPGTFYGSSSAAGLGWGFGAALGGKLASPDSLVIATLGDGSYIFANPVACHYASKLHDLPVLVVVFNNQEWNAVRRATLNLYPDGAAASDVSPAFCNLEQLLAFEKICSSAGGYGERVDDPLELPAALLRAKKSVMQEGRQALINVICCAEE